jgi:hypothetical protein
LQKPSRGILLVQQTIDLLHGSGEGKKRIQIVDLKDANGKPAGTEITVTLPTGETGPNEN